MDLNMKYELNEEVNRVRAFEKVIAVANTVNADRSATLFIWLMENILPRKSQEWYEGFCYVIYGWIADKIKIIELQKDPRQRLLDDALKKNGTLKISLIKGYRAFSQSGLKEAKEWVEENYDFDGPDKATVKEV